MQHSVEFKRIVDLIPRTAHCPRGTAIHAPKVKHVTKYAQKGFSRRAAESKRFSVRVAGRERLANGTPGCIKQLQGKKARSRLGRSIDQ
jgi:hypothetical protein